MEIRLLGTHNLASRGTGHTCFLIDGVLGIDAGSVASALTWEEQQRVAAILLTHRHFDHLRDIPTVGLATLGAPTQIQLYGLPETLDALHAHILNGDVYPDLTLGLNGSPARFSLHNIERSVTFQVLGYQVKPVPMQHGGAPAVGYIVRSPTGGCVAYTGDTSGDLLPMLQDALAPGVLFVDVTFPDRLAARAEASGHLTPSSLRSRLLTARDAGARLPSLVPVHLDLETADEVTAELAALGAELGIDLTPGSEDVTIVVGPEHGAS
jgi:ribonuclease BN (tRNA processing enzyme)